MVLILFVVQLFHLEVIWLPMRMEMIGILDLKVLENGLIGLEFTVLRSRKLNLLGLLRKIDKYDNFTYMILSLFNNLSIFLLTAWL